MFCVKQIEQYIISIKHDVSVPSFTFVPWRVANTLKISKGLRVVLKREPSPMLIIILSTVSTAGDIITSMLVIFECCRMNWDVVLLGAV